jgi:hypothetical protein
MKSKLIILGVVGLGLVMAAILLRHDRTAPLVVAPATAPAHSNEAALIEVPKEAPKPTRTAPPEPIVTAPLPSPVTTIMGTNGESAKVRWKAVQSLSHSLNRLEIQTLYGYLAGHETETNAHMRGVLKNDVILALKAQQPPPADLTSVLLGLFNDPDQDPVIRDYALQHLISAYDQGPERPAVQEALWKAAAETNASLAGTALLGLHRLSQTDPQIDSSRVSQMAQAMAGDSGALEAVRITAIQVCAERQLVSALPSISNALSSPDSGITLQMSAVAALGALGDASQVPILERLKSTGNPAIQTAVDAALKKLKRRVQG